MKSRIELASQALEDLWKSTEDFLSKHCKICRSYDPGQHNNFFPSHEFEYSELDKSGLSAQSRLYNQFDFFKSLITPLKSLKPLPLGSNSIDSICTTMDRILLEKNGTYHNSISQVHEEANNVFDSLRQFLGRITSDSIDKYLLIPDTNALYINPVLEKWQFNEYPNFTLVFVPTVFSELDQHKTNHPNDQVRDKAKKVLRMIKGYRKRGSGRLTSLEGINLKKGISKMRAIVGDSDSISLPSWLDPTVNDDRIIISALGLMLQHPHSAIAIVTDDMNMQNKAEIAGLYFLDPPEPEPQENGGFTT